MSELTSFFLSFRKKLGSTTEVKQFAKMSAASNSHMRKNAYHRHLK